MDTVVVSKKIIKKAKVVVSVSKILFGLSKNNQIYLIIQK